MIKYKFENLKNKIITKFEMNSNKDRLIFTDNNNNSYTMYHSQICCEDVYIEDVIGEFDDILNSPILMADEIFGEDEYFDWTFYKLATIKGYVTIRWYGSGNYSTAVSFYKNI